MLAFRKRGNPQPCLDFRAENIHEPLSMRSKHATTETMFDHRATEGHGRVSMPTGPGTDERGKVSNGKSLTLQAVQHLPYLALLHPDGRLDPSCHSFREQRDSGLTRPLEAGLREGTLRVWECVTYLVNGYNGYRTTHTTPLPTPTPLATTPTPARAPPPPAPRYFFRPLVFLYLSPPPPVEPALTSPVLLLNPRIFTHSGQNQRSGSLSGSSFMHFTWNCEGGALAMSERGNKRERKRTKERGKSGKRKENHETERTHSNRQASLSHPIICPWLFS